ncbi:MAG: hypothetical protein WBL25_00135 [Anaerolineales bacterium]
MKKIIPMLFTSIGGILGGLYGFLTMMATIPALIASDIPIPTDFIGKFQNRFFSVLLPIMVVFGWWIGKWRTAQIEELIGWRKWTALVLLGLIVAVLGYAASVALFFLSA